MKGDKKMKKIDKQLNVKKKNLKFTLKWLHLTHLDYRHPMKIKPSEKKI